MRKDEVKIPWWVGNTDENIWETWHKLHTAYCPSEYMARFLSKLQEGSHVMDLGCGNGINSYYMSAIGLKPIGVDGSENALMSAESNSDLYDLSPSVHQPPVFLFANLTKPLMFTTEQFDAVIDICTLQHIPKENIKSLLLEIKRILKPSGKLFSKLASEQTTYRSDVAFSPPEFRTLKEVEELFSDFKIIEINHVERTVNNGSGTIAHWLVELGV